MPEVTVTLTPEEVIMVLAALTRYRMAGFPLERSTYANSISRRDRREWASFGMKLWDKFADLRMLARQGTEGREP